MKEEKPAGAGLFVDLSDFCKRVDKVAPAARWRSDRNLLFDAEVLSIARGLRIGLSSSYQQIHELMNQLHSDRHGTTNI